MIYSWQEIENQKLKYNYHEPYDYYSAFVFTKTIEAVIV